MNFNYGLAFLQKEDILIVLYATIFYTVCFSVVVRPPLQSYLNTSHEGVGPDPSPFEVIICHLF